MEDKRVSIYDIAEKTGYSAVTVHRALNNKGRISEKTKKLILETARQIGYKANPAAQGLRRAPIKIGAVLFCQVEEYVDGIIHGIAAGGQDLEKYNVSTDIRKIDYTDDLQCINTTCDIVNEFADKHYNGVILFASTGMDKLMALCDLLKDISAKGIPFATVASDIPMDERVIYVGINAFMAGSMAAEMLELSCANRDVALLVARDTSPVDKDYIDGFLDYAKKSVFSGIRIYEHFDERDKVIAATERMLEENPNLSGIYMASASSVLACECISVEKSQELAVVTTDLLKKTPELLKSRIANATIFQDPFAQGKLVVRLLYNYITTKKDCGQHFILPQILLSSNVDAYLSENS